MKPILFNTEMVKAILDGRKTVTRRILKLPKWVWINDEGNFEFATTGDNGTVSPDKLISYLHINPYKGGDILYVRETFRESYEHSATQYEYKADKERDTDYVTPFNWRPSIHMSKEAARIFLEVTDVRVERLQEISCESVTKEGCSCIYRATSVNNSFQKLWDSTIKKSDFNKYGWNANPWVWVYEFKRINKEESK